MMTPGKHIAYRLFVQTVVLLFLYALVALLGAVQFVDSHFLVNVFPYHQLGALAHVLLYMSILTGLAGGGIYLVASERADGTIKNEPLLGYVSHGWTVLLVLVFLAGIFGLLDSSAYRMELPLLLDVLLAILLGAFVFLTAMSVTIWSAIPTVWTVGMVIAIGCILVGLYSPADHVQTAAIRVLVVGIQFNIGFVLAAVALGFWLMHRFSNITRGWAEHGLLIVGGFLSLAGLLVSLPPLYGLVERDLVRTVGGVGVLFGPLAVMIFAAHSYRALSDRNQSRTLAAHWYALALILFIAGIGIVGAVGTIRDVNQWTQGTRLSDLQYSLVALGVTAVVLGVINQGVAELRGENRRITGLMPFWLVAFGIISVGAALAAAGIVQVYLERIFGVGYLDVQRELAPLYQGWIGGLILVLVGIVIYALGFWARRVR